MLCQTMRYKKTTDVYFETTSDLDHAVFTKSQRRKQKNSYVNLFRTFVSL
jgi:hypothetical protein